MNCPFHIKAYKSKIRSYKDLPIKYAEFGTVYRYERSGTLHGLTRVRGFTQDDAHIICTPEQMPKELEKLVKHGLKILKNFGFKEYNIYLSTRPEGSAGTDEGWKMATDTLKQVLNKLKLKYEVDQGGGVFYGPKIDIKIKDSLGREWQCTTVQFDFNLPEKFELRYINEKGEQKEPFMIHRALLGSLERFFGVLIEHYAGAFPFWLCPVQVWIVPIAKTHKKYAKGVFEQLKSEGMRVELKDDNETISKKIREGEMQKIPYILVVGDREIKRKTISVRERGKKETKEMKIKTFVEKKK
jgi:threonyl-tRNA synthetase